MGGCIETVDDTGCVGIFVESRLLGLKGEGIVSLKKRVALISIRDLYSLICSD